MNSNFSVVKGSSLLVGRFNATASEGSLTGSVVSFFAGAESEPALIQATSASPDGDTTVSWDPSDGSLSVTLGPDSTALLGAGTHQYQLKLELSDGHIFDGPEGVILVRQTIDPKV